MRGTSSWYLPASFALHGGARPTRTVNTSSASWQSGARVAVAVAGDAGMMVELSAVPLGQWQWPWGDHRRTGSAPGADARAASKARFVYVTLMCTVEMDSAKIDISWCFA